MIKKSILYDEQQIYVLPVVGKPYILLIAMLQEMKRTILMTIKLLKSS